MRYKTRFKKTSRVLGIISIVIALVNLLYNIFTNRNLGFAITILCCVIVINAGAYKLDKETSSNNN